VAQNDKKSIEIQQNTPLHNVCILKMEPAKRRQCPLKSVLEIQRTPGEAARSLLYARLASLWRDHVIKSGAKEKLREKRVAMATFPRRSVRFATIPLNWLGSLQLAVQNGGAHGPHKELSNMGVYAVLPPLVYLLPGVFQQFLSVNWTR
jgi:hypothetical protein